MPKPILCLDFDGVIHSYRSGWQGPAVISDPPVPGAIEFIRSAVAYFSVAIFSARSQQPGGISAMRAWLEAWAARELPPGADLAFLQQVTWPTEKPQAFVTLDDRGLTFTGEWPSLEALRAFRPWYRQSSQDEPGAGTDP
jgi:hypothetical protein